MLTTADAAALADHFDIGTDPRLSGPVARGEQGQIWRLTTSRGAWAVKEPFEAPPPDAAEEAASFQEAAVAAGVPAPTVVRTTDGAVFAEVGSAAVRLFGWVDLHERSAMVDPGAVGRVVAAVHQVPFAGRLPVDEWYTDPIGTDRWDELVTLLTDAGAPFAADLAGYRDDLVRLETLMEAPADLRTCHRDLFADNVLGTDAGGLCVIDWENCGLADPSQELGLVAFDFGARRPRPDHGLARRLHGRGRSRPVGSAEPLLDGHRAGGAHRGAVLPSLAGGDDARGAGVCRGRRGGVRRAVPPHNGRRRADGRGGRRRGASQGRIVAETVTRRTWPTRGPEPAGIRTPAPRAASSRWPASPPRRP